MTGWDERAAEATRVLIGTFWDGRRALFRTVASRLSWRRIPWHYWWQAHALDALVLAGDLDRADRLGGGILRRNDGITNNYYDDMAWLGLALHGLEHAGGRTDSGALVAELMGSLRGGVGPGSGAMVR